MRGNQMIVQVDGYDSRAKAAQLIGKRVLWASPAKREIYGKIIAVHGNSGTVRARFNRGMPGQAIGAKVAIMEKVAATEEAKPQQPKKLPAKKEDKPKAKAPVPKAEEKAVPKAEEKAVPKAEGQPASKAEKK